MIDGRVTVNPFPVTPALVQTSFWFKVYKSRGLLNVGETPALIVLYLLFS